MEKKACFFEQDKKRDSLCSLAYDLRQSGYPISLDKWSEKLLSFFLKLQGDMNAEYTDKENKNSHHQRSDCTFETSG